MTYLLFSSDFSIFMFADDVKGTAVTKSERDCRNLQNQLDKINEWANRWQLPLSLEKCSIITFFLSNKPINFHCKLGNTVLQRTSSINDLGVLMTQNLSFSEHINTICATARSRSAVILKCFFSRDKNLLFKAFISFVRPLLE